MAVYEGSGHAPNAREPVRASFRGREALTNPPPSSGGILIAYGLEVLERLGEAGTEQVVAAISPQTWVDGKLLGLTAAAFGTLLTYGFALGMFFTILKLSGMDVPIPWAALRPEAESSPMWSARSRRASVPSRGEVAPSRAPACG